MSASLHHMARICKAYGPRVMACVLVLFEAGFLGAAPNETLLDTVPKIAPKEAIARTLFRRKSYPAALLLLKDDALTAEGQWIKAETLFRMDEWALAKPYFLAIASGNGDAIERRKAAIRLFDIAIKQGDLKESFTRLMNYQKEFSSPPSRMRYALGKALYDAQDDRAQKVLLGIKRGNEFYGRAQYILATIGLDKKDIKTALKEFNQIEKQKPVSVEDHSIIQMATLAQARLLVDHGHEDLAAKAYARVRIGPFKEVALSEHMRAMIKRAHEAKNGQGRFKDIADFKRGLIERESLQSAAKALRDYRKTQSISWENIELTTLTASLMVETGRYDDARVVLDKLANHFRSLHASLTASKPQELWPLFTLNFSDLNLVRTRLVEGILESLQKGLSGVHEIVALRDRIEAGHRHLEELLDKARLLGPEQVKLLSKAQAAQAALEEAYVEMAENIQAKLSPQLAGIINQQMAEAEFLRAELVVREMAALEQQTGAAQRFQNEKIELFEAKLKEADKGSAP